LRAQGLIRRTIAWTLLMVILPAAISLTAMADSDIVVVTNEYRAVFADRLRFTLAIESATPIVEATLRYRRGEGPLITRVPVPITPGQHVVAEYVRPLDRGEIPPGTTMTYHWTLVDQEGTKHHTEPVAFVYEDDRFDWRMISSPEITLLWYEDEEQARSLFDDAMAALRRLEDEIGVHMEQPVRIYAYQKSADMRAALFAHSEGYDARVLTMGVVVSDDTLLLLASHRDAHLTIAHELSHVVVGFATDNPYSDLPRWLDEGLAMYAQGELQEANQRALARSIRDDTLISVRSLSGYTGIPEEVDLYYGEVHSLVEYLIRTHGKEKMTELLATCREGIRQEDALTRVFGFGLDQLDSDWRASLGLGPRGEAQPSSDPRPSPEKSPAACSLIPLLSLMGLAGALPHGPRP